MHPGIVTAGLFLDIRDDGVLGAHKGISGQADGGRIDLCCVIGHRSQDFRYQAGAGTLIVSCGGIAVGDIVVFRV